MASSFKLLYRDVDRTPFLFTLEACARDRGLELEIEQHRAERPSASGTGQEWGVLLEEGKVDLISENYWGLQSYRALGSPFVTVASVCSLWQEELVVSPEITTLDDLHGTRFAVRSSGPGTVFPHMWLAENGFDDVECEVISERVVGRWGQWKAVAEGTHQVCMMSPIYLAPALAAGLKVLAYPLVELAGGNIALTTTESIVAERQDDLQRLVAAVFDAIGLFKAHSPRVLEIMTSACAPLLAEHFEDVSDAAMTRMLELLAAELTEIPFPTPEGVVRTRKMRLDTAPELEDFNPMLMWEPSFVRRELAARRP